MDRPARRFFEPAGAPRDRAEAAPGVKCPKCGWTGPRSELAGTMTPFLHGCPACWNHGRYIPVEAAR